MYELSYDGGPAKKTVSDVLRDTYEELFVSDPKVIHVDADLLRCISLHKIQEKFPNNIIDCGIQEANAVGVAAGLNLAGYKPFVHTFAPFASRRVFDTAFISVAYAKKSVRIIGSDPGITAKANGGTHMPFEDIGMYRLIPEATVIDITDAAMLRSIVRSTVNRSGLTYIRMPRKGIPDVYKMGSEFEIGKAELLMDGSDVTIIAAGIMVATALDAAEILKERGIYAQVVDIVSIKPIDTEMILNCAEKTGAIVTAENHNVIGGLGSAVSETLDEIHPTPVVRVGVKDKFGQVGTLPYLRKVYGLTAEDIADAAVRAISLKKK